MVEQFGLIDKVFSVTLDNAFSNAKAMDTLTPMFALLVIWVVILHLSL